MGANDWEDLMNGVFGSGGKLNFGRQKDLDREARSTLAQAQQELDELLERQKKARRDLEKVSHQQLQKNSDAIDAELRRQAKEIEELSGSLARDLQADGLLTPAQVQQNKAPMSEKERISRFSACADQVNQQVLGQQAFVQSLCNAFQRSFLYGTQGKAARAVTLISGADGSGRHTALTLLTRALAEKELLVQDGIVWLDLGLYPGPGQEKLFLQDLYAALAAPAQVVAFERYEQCHPGFLHLLGQLLARGEAALSSRYVVQKGLLVDVGTALAPNAVSSLTPEGKYFFFVSEKGLSSLVEKMGSDFVNSLGPVCSTAPLEEEHRQAAAKRALDQMLQKAGEKLGFQLTATPEVCRLAAGQYSAAKGMQPVMDWCDRCYKALSEYKLNTGAAAGMEGRLDVQENRLTLIPGTAQPVELLGLLPGVYTAELDAVKAELADIVGLDEVKDYVLGLADNAQVQKRREAAGMKANRLSMHMIFAGNPGTGKTTIARLVAKYLKAVGVLRGGQLVEVSRADLVGRYVGHTAPLTNQVIASALGGVLFIDEAYSLYRGKDDSFGLEAIDTLVKGMEDHRDDLVVVLAGYTREMEQFLEANSGLASRFPNQIEFPDYTAEQLLRILHIQAGSKGYRLAPECDGPVQEWFARQQAKDAAKNGNGRMARNLLEAAMLKQARRLVTLPDAALDELLLEDFDLTDPE